MLGKSVLPGLLNLLGLVGASKEESVEAGREDAEDGETEFDSVCE